MEFGFFEDLSETDQAYIREILACKTSACKEGKKPQFAWINNVEYIASFDQLEGTACIKVDEEQGSGQSVLPDSSKVAAHGVSNVHHEPVPTQMVHVPVSVVPGIGPQPTYTMGFGMSPFINYAPGMPIMAPHYSMTHAPGMMPVFLPQMNYMPAVPVSIPSGQQTIPLPTQAEVSLNHVMPAVNNEKEGEKWAEKTPQKVQERRNKKRRPPDYYERIASSQESSRNTDDNGSVNMNQSDAVDTPAVNTNVVDNERTNTESVHLSNVPEQQVTSSQFAAVSSSGNNAELPATNPVHIVSEGYVSKPQNTVQPSHNRYTSPPPPDCSSPAAVVEEDPAQYADVVGHTSAEIRTFDSPAQVDHHHHSSPQPEAVHHSQPSSSSKSAESESTHITLLPTEPNTDTPQGASCAQAQAQNNTGDSAHSEPETHKVTVTETDSPVESGDSDIIKEAPVTLEQGTAPKDTLSKADQGTGAPLAPKKPNTWAGLFSGTKEAKNATIIYTAKETGKEKDGEKVSEPKPEEKIPTVVAASEDGLARHIADVLLNHHLNHKAISLQPRGLKNRRNWCYISATLQALLACPPFYHLMKALPKREGNSTENSSTPVMDCLYRFINEFSYLPYRSIEQNKVLNAKGTVKLDIPQGPTFEPTYVYDVLKTSKYSSAFLDGRQEDAEEFFSSFINGLHDEMVACSKLLAASDSECEAAVLNGVVGHEEHAGGKSKQPEEEDGWEQVGPKNKAVVTRTTTSPISPVSALFQGQVRSILHQSGARESATLQPFFTLQLDIQSDKVLTVKDALDGLVRKESLQDFTCSKTKQEVEATRRMTLEELPPVLVLHLKYFLYDKSGGCLKINKNIEYGVDLEISRDLLSPNMKSKLSVSQRKYKLFGVVNHHGARALGGHYTTYVYHPGINGWIHIDDEIVRSVSPAQVLKHNPPKVPYLLYYRRIDHVQ